MKKSQVLAALALAFALGVVAPVAGVANAASEFNEATANTLGTANCEAGNNSINHVKKSAAFNAVQAYMVAYDNYMDDLAAGERVDLSYTDADTYVRSLKKDLDDVISELTKYATAYVKNNPTLLDTTDINAAVAEANKSNANTFTLDILKDAIDAIEDNMKKGNPVQDLHKVAEILNSTNPSIADQRMVVEAFNALGFYIEAIGPYPATSDAHDIIQQSYTTINGTDLATVLKKLHVDTVYVTDNYNAYIRNRDAFQKALRDLFNSGLLVANSAGFGESRYTTDTATQTAIVNVKAGPVYEDREFIIFDAANGGAASYKSNNNIHEFDFWEDAVYEVNAIVRECRKATPNTVSVYNSILTLADKFAHATGDNRRAIVIAREMVKTAATNDEINDDKNLVDEPNNNNPAAPDAPASGILDTTEHSATTISIVAGLATALTALGAGVVAYRNARREK